VNSKVLYEHPQIFYSKDIYPGSYRHSVPKPWYFRAMNEYDSFMLQSAYDVEFEPFHRINLKEYR